MIVESAPETNNSYWCTSAPNVQRAWSSSSLDTLQTCAYKYYLQYVLGLRSPVTPPLAFGSIYHSALEKYDAARLSGLSPRASTVPALKSVLKDLQASEFPQGDTARNAHTLLRAVAWYAHAYTEDPYTTMVINGEPAIEVSFKIALPLSNPDGEQYLLTGFLDGAVQYAGTYNFVRERKTTKTTLSSSFFRQYKLTNQSFLYTVAGNVVLGKKFHGILYDVAQTAVSFTEFARHQETRTEAQLEEWLQGTMEWIKYAENLAESGHYPRNHSACGHYGGCPFSSYCSKDPGIRENFTPDQFTLNRRTEIDARGD